jgi:DNA-binding NarL/FixJ family response regulator
MGITLELTMVNTTRKVLVVEDDVLLASLVKKSLIEAGFLVETAQETAKARKKVKDFDPDLVLLDLALGDGPSGVHLAHALHDTRPDIAVLVLTKYSDAKSISSQAQDLPDSVGFIRKQLIEEPGQLVEAIEKVLADRPSEVRHDRQDAKPFQSLPDKGQEVLRLLAESCSNQEISKRTGLSVKSVERWIDRIYQELGIEVSGSINPRVAAVTKYLRAIGAVDKN